jgi:hypothetical protein
VSDFEIAYKVKDCSEIGPVTGMVTLKNEVYFFTKDAVYKISKKPRYARLWNWINGHE